MKTGIRRRERGGKLKALAACLAAVILAASCTVYKFKEMDGQALAAKPPKGKIVSVTTADARIDFSKDDPARVKDKAIVGNVHATLTLDPYDIADVTPAGKLTRVVYKDGDRFLVRGSRRAEDRILCDVVYPKYIPLEKVASVRVVSVNAAASILSTLGGVALLAGALALDTALSDDDEEIDFEDTFTGGLVSLAVDSIAEPSPKRTKLPRSLKELSALKAGGDTAGEKEFWALEWTSVAVAPGEDGKYRVPIVNATGVPRGVDEAKLVVVDHPPGLGVAPDVQGNIRGISGLVPPAAATDGDGLDIAPLVRDKDDVFWRSRGGDSSAGRGERPRDELILQFPKPKGARGALLVVNVTNTAWPPQFAGEALERAKGQAKDGKVKPAYQDWEYSKLRVGLLTGFGWQTGQVIFAGGPLPAGDMAYRIDLEDVVADEVSLKLSPPAGYWLIDRVALGFDDENFLECEVVDAEGLAEPEVAEVLRALAVEDGSTVFLEAPGQETVITFAAPPLKEGMERTVFLRTVSCYEMPARETRDRSTPSRRPGPPAR